MRRALALTALIALVPAGCGRGDDNGAETSAAAAIDLQVTLWPNGDAGDYRGRTVHSRFTHENACKSGRWERIAPVFPTGF